MKELTLEAKIENIPKVTAFIDEELEARDCSMKAQVQLDVAVDELFSNVSYYAYAPDTGYATIRFEYDEQTDTAQVTMIDRGVPYNPLEKEDPDVTLSAKEREVGGLGIFLVKKTMDDMTYCREDGANIVRIKKRLH